jgi:hypothetical protein
MEESSVGKPLLKPVTFRNIENLTVERNPIYVSNVGKPLVVPHTFIHI